MRFRDLIEELSQHGLVLCALSKKRLEHITLQEVRGRVKAFRDLVHFSLDGEE